MEPRRSGPGTVPVWQVVRAVLIAGLSVAVCAATLAVLAVVVVGGFVRGQPVAGGEWVGVAAFGGPALVGFLVAMRAHRRRLEESRAVWRSAGWLAAAVPVLLLLGVGAGVVLGWLYHEARVGQMDDLDRSACHAVLGEDDPPAGLDACLPIARACRLEAEAAEKPSIEEQKALNARWPAHLKTPLSVESRLRLLCVFERTNAR